MLVRKPVCQTKNNVAVALEENQEAVLITLPCAVQQVLVRILRHTVIWGEHQGLRMKNACEDLAHVLVVPSGYFSSSAQAVP
jgi:hypothetical protein